MEGIIKVLIVEDSPTCRDLIVSILESEGYVRVVGTAANGEEAIGAVNRLQPDLVTMDVHMPGISGFEATRRIMETQPVPIIVMSGTLDDEVVGGFEALEAGALAFVRRPPHPGHAEYPAVAAQLRQMVRLLSEVRVVRRRPVRRSVSPGRPGARRAEVAVPDARLLAIGASTGGPVVLQVILSALAGQLPVPVLIVQHIAAGFAPGLAEWLTRSSALPVHIAADNERLLAGHVYIAPDDRHVGVSRGGVIQMSDAPPEHGLRPSVSFLFRSVAQSMGRQAIGVLLTGMGRDGAAELKLMREQGALTIAQDQESSVIYGMPGEAVRLGGADHVLPPAKIAALLSELMSRHAAGRKN